MIKRTTKLTALLLAASMVVTLAGCKNDPAATSPAKGVPTASAEGEQTNAEKTDSPASAKTDKASVTTTGKDATGTVTDKTGTLPATTESPAEEKNTVTTTEGKTLGVTVPQGEYNKGIVLVKVKDKFQKKSLGKLAYTSAEPLYKGAKWYTITLKDEDKTEEAVEYLTKLDTFENVDYDYIMGVTADVENVNVSCNPDYDKQKNHPTHEVPKGWDYTKENGKKPGGNSDVIVAVIDTGVDYNHLDLRNNIWKNTAEIPNNGKDDDGNGYIDDVYGWDCVGNDKDPMDDNGHGTHVAGIIAAENNEIGGVGVAYNCKIMVLKAGNSSGYFNNADIAEAIQYAYMNGASVINMSFGGSNISMAVEDALTSAYNSCVLVAAAGNDGACNNLACKTCENVAVSYPAALPYVIGVMSTNHDGSYVSGFSNYDHNPYNSVEYEVYAVGEAVPSCWPGNKYASLNGTSMAAPTVSGIAALLRSYYTDREVYSTKFIQSQIVNTGTRNPYNPFTEKGDDAHSVANVYEALTRFPKPEVNLYDYTIDDSKDIASANNGNGVIDAGETVRLHISLHNRGGVASNVNVSIDTKRGEGLTDPYFNFVNPTMKLSDIGTYSVRESGDKYFEIKVSSDCPNDYLVDFNIRYTYTNGMDSKDTTTYHDDGKQKAQFNVSSGYHVPRTFTEDTTYKADRLYIIGEDVVIPEGITVTFEEGCQIQFYDDREYYNSPSVTVYGTLNLKGTKEKMVKVRASERYSEFLCLVYPKYTGNFYAEYIDAVNLSVGEINSKLKDGYIRDSYLVAQTDASYWLIENGVKSIDWLCLFVNQLQRNYIREEGCTLRRFGLGNGHTDWDSNYFFTCNRSGGSGDVHYGILVSNFTNNYVNAKKYGKYNCFGETENNVFVYTGQKVSDLPRFNLTDKNSVKNNTFSKIYQDYASQIFDGYYDASGQPTLDLSTTCSDRSLLWPHVVNLEMFNADGEAITTVGREKMKVRVTFNRPMDTTKDTYITFGSVEPYADYKITGEYISDTVWEGTYTLKAQIENGQNYMVVHNACAAEDETKRVFGEHEPYEFTIDTTSAMSMNLQAVETDDGIALTWAQDDYDTLMGYNIYRSEQKDGNYVKINPAILLPTEKSFLDENAEPGKTYWYTFTVVLSDFTESAPAGKVMATAKDTQSPSLYHTPVNQGYENNNLVITCTASDNVAIKEVTLYYRIIGTSDWKSLAMGKKNDKYSATIFGSDVTLQGLEYYIVATDGINTVNKGDAETPYQIVVKAADSLLGMGDVDGSGSVTTKDALMLMQCLNGDLILTDDAFKRADLNGDGVLSSAEALRILQYVNGKIQTLEM